MTAREYFGAIVRAMGVYFLAFGAAASFGFFAPAPGYTPVQYLFMYVPQMVAGVILMFAADGFVQTCYSKVDADGYSENS